MLILLITTFEILIRMIPRLEPFLFFMLEEKVIYLRALEIGLVIVVAFNGIIVANTVILLLQELFE